MELLRRPGRWASEGLVVPAERTIVRILQPLTPLAVLAPTERTLCDEVDEVGVKPLA